MNGYQKIEYIEPVYTTAFKHVHPVTRQDVPEGSKEEDGMLTPRVAIDVSFPSGHKTTGIFAWQLIKDGVVQDYFTDSGTPIDQHPTLEHRLTNGGAFEWPTQLPMPKWEKERRAEKAKLEAELAAMPED